MLGGEIAGTIERISDDVTDFKEGNAVYGMIPSGGFAEYAIDNMGDIVAKPRMLDFEHAAAIPLDGLTAWQAMFDVAQLNSWQRMFIIGTSGGVGSLAMQLAKAQGAYVIGMASGRNEAFVKALGADEFVDYTQQRFEDVVNDVDVVFDTVGSDMFERAFHTLKHGGFLVTAVQFPSEAQAQAFGVKTARVFCTPNADQLAAITKLVDDGKVQAYVATVVPLADVNTALQLSETGRTRGKIVVHVST